VTATAVKELPYEIVIDALTVSVCHAGNIGADYPMRMSFLRLIPIWLRKPLRMLQVITE
jgi:hypothetical protein